MSLELSKVLVLGAGKVGRTIADTLAEHCPFAVTLADRVPGTSSDPRVRRVLTDVENAEAGRRS